VAEAAAVVAVVCSAGSSSSSSSPASVSCSAFLLDVGPGLAGWGLGAVVAFFWSSGTVDSGLWSAAPSVRNDVTAIQP